MMRQQPAKRILIVLAFLSVGLLCIAGRDYIRILTVKHFASLPELRSFEPPGKTSWKPDGPRSVRAFDPVSGHQPAFFRTFHSDTMCSDEVSIAIAPVFTLDWVAEEEMFVVEGPTFDRDGNIYFCPIWPREDVILVSLDRETGKRRWAIRGFSHGGGAPLVLNDPETGSQVIYLGTYDRAVAVRPDGSLVWDVPTGLPRLKRSDDPVLSHCWGLNYHVQEDALVGVTSDARLYVLDRKTGAQRLASPHLVPGSKSPKMHRPIPPNIGSTISKELKPFFAEPGSGFDPFATILKAILAEEVMVANYFAIDANTGRIWVAATAPDREDGQADGVSEQGALYGFDCVYHEGQLEIRQAAALFFHGGTSSTPALSADGTRVYVGDAGGRLMAIDTSSGEAVWSLKVGDYLICSMAVTADNREIYATTPTDFVKIVDHGDRGEIVWHATLDMYRPGLFQRNLSVLQPVAGANGLAVQAGAGVVAKGRPMIFTCGVGLLDRETGKLRYFAEGREESVAVTSVGPDGGIYLAHSPLRRALARAVFGDKLPPLSGGIARYRPTRHDVFIRDALWAAGTRAENAHLHRVEYPKSAGADIRQIQRLMTQCRQSAPKALAEGSLRPETWKRIEAILQSVQRNLTVGGLDHAAISLKNASNLIR